MGPVNIVDLSLKGPRDYLEIDNLQRTLHAQRLEGGPDSIIEVEFTPTYTAGRHTHDEDIKDLDLHVIRTDRGGSVTWHGPGQLVVYPVVQLREPIDHVAWIRSVEAAVLASLREDWNLGVERVEGRSGVWLRAEGQPDRKICAIGLKVAQGVTLHGLALNVNPDFSSAFTGIIPCGLRGTAVTSLAVEGISTTIGEVGARLLPRLLESIAPLLDRPIGTVSTVNLETIRP